MHIYPGSYWAPSHKLELCRPLHTKYLCKCAGHEHERLTLNSSSSIMSCARRRSNIFVHLIFVIMRDHENFLPWIFISGKFVHAKNTQTTVCMYVCNWTPCLTIHRQCVNFVSTVKMLAAFLLFGCILPSLGGKYLLQTFAQTILLVACSLPFTFPQYAPLDNVCILNGTLRLACCHFSKWFGMCSLYESFCRTFNCYIKPIKKQYSMYSRNRQCFKR